MSRPRARDRIQRAARIAHPVVRTTALLIAATLVAPACAEDGAEPIEAAKAFAHAAQTGNVKAVLPLLERSAIERLELAAERAGNQVGGRRNVEPNEMLQIVDVDPTFQIARTELLDNDGEVAHVQLIGADDEAHVLELVYEDGSWRVRIPKPQVASARASS